MYISPKYRLVDRNGKTVVEYGGRFETTFEVLGDFRYDYVGAEDGVRVYRQEASE